MKGSKKVKARARRIWRKMTGIEKKIAYQLSFLPADLEVDFDNFYFCEGGRFPRIQEKYTYTLKRGFSGNVKIRGRWCRWPSLSLWVLIDEKMIKIDCHVRELLIKQGVEWEETAEKLEKALEDAYRHIIKVIQEIKNPSSLAFRREFREKNKEIEELKRRVGTLAEAIFVANEELKKTKSSFKSPKIARIRKNLSDALKKAGIDPLEE